MKAMCRCEVCDSSDLCSASILIIRHVRFVKSCGLVKRGYAFNVPSIPAPLSFNLSKSIRLFQVKAGGESNLILDTVKTVQDWDPMTNNFLILRLYESFGQRGTAELYAGRGLHILSAEHVDILEEKIQSSDPKEVLLVGKGVFFEYRPFEVITLKVKLGARTRKKRKETTPSGNNEETVPGPTKRTKQSK